MSNFIKEKNSHLEKRRKEYQEKSNKQHSKMQMQKWGCKRADSLKGAKEQPRSYSFHLFHETNHIKRWPRNLKKHEA